MSTIRVILADDNPLVRMGLRSLLDASDVVDVVGEASNGAEAIELVAELKPDVALLDVRMPELDGVAAAAQIAAQAHVLMLTSSEEPEIIEAAMRNGARGYLVHGAHSPDEIVAAIATAARGSMVLGPAAAAATAAAFAGSSPGAAERPGSSGPDFGLTTREVEIMAMVADGKSNREIARACFLAEKTVKNHINRIFPKLGVSTRAEAVARWLRMADRSGDEQTEARSFRV